MRSLLLASLGLLLVACGSDGGSNNPAADANNNPGPDARTFLDAPPTQTVQVTVSGQATEQTTSGATALAGVTIAAYRNADETTPIAMTTSDALGNYSLTIQTNGESIDGFLKATKTGYKETYLYPPYPLMADFSQASVIMVTQTTYDNLSAIAQGNQQAGQGLIGCIVTDGTNPVAGATVSSDPAATAYRYNAVAGTIVFPSANATSTHTDGVAYMFNVPPGQVTVSAMKTGTTFSSHTMKAWADQLTTTVIVP